MLRPVVKSKWQTVACDICGSSDHEGLGQREYIVQHKTKDFLMHFNDVVCSNCGFVFASLRPSEEFLFDYYSDAHDSYEGAQDIDIDFDADSRVSLLNQYVSKGSTILEIGAGAGHFCRYLSDNGYLAEGLDPKEQEEAYGVHKSYISSEKNEHQEPEKKYDAIVSYYVMEHLRSPNEWLQEALKYLKPEGYLVVEVPDFSLYPLECLNNEHFLHYRTEHLEALLKNHGFEIMEGIQKNSRYFGCVVTAKFVGKVDSCKVLNFDIEKIKCEAYQNYQKATENLKQKEEIAGNVSKKIVAFIKEHPNAQVCFWGANEYASRISRCFPVNNHNFLVIDNASTKKGLCHKGFNKPIISPESDNINKDGGVLFILCSPAWNKSIKNQIEEMMFNDYLIIDGVTAENL